MAVPMCQPATGHARWPHSFWQWQCRYRLTRKKHAMHVDTTCQQLSLTPEELKTGRQLWMGFPLAMATTCTHHLRYIRSHQALYEPSPHNRLYQDADFHLHNRHFTSVVRVQPQHGCVRICFLPSGQVLEPPGCLCPPSQLGLLNNILLRLGELHAGLDSLAPLSKHLDTLQPSLPWYISSHRG